MHNNNNFYSQSNYANGSTYNSYATPYPYWQHTPAGHHTNCWEAWLNLKDYGPNPFVIDIEEATEQNNTFRTALWTGQHLQLTLMSIDVGDDIGLEVHPTLDQFLRIEDGRGLVIMGDSQDNLYFRRNVRNDYAVFIPAGTWHNLINTGHKPIKLYSIYAPPAHPHGTVHETKEDEGNHYAY